MGQPVPKPPIGHPRRRIGRLEDFTVPAKLAPALEEGIEEDGLIDDTIEIKSEAEYLVEEERDA